MILKFSFFEDDDDIANGMFSLPSSIVSHLCPVHIFQHANRILVCDIFVGDIDEFRVVTLADENSEDSAPALEV